MSINQQPLSAGMQIGDYLLIELFYEGPTTTTWLAKQESVGRDVIIDSLNIELQQDHDIVETFLSDVRTKAKVDHPLIGSVFEAVREDNFCFYTREKITGESVYHMAKRGKEFTPAETVHLLKQIAEANLYLESYNVASLPLSPHQAFVSNTQMCRVINMAVGGDRDQNVSTQDKVTFGTFFNSVLKKGEPGATRTASLLAYMMDQEREIPLTWEQIKELSAGVENQLCEPIEPVELESHTMALKNTLSSKRFVMGAGIVIGLLLAFMFASLLIKREKPPLKRELEGEVFIKSGRYSNFDGIKGRVKAFVIDSHEVTIAEYAKFLNEIDSLGRAKLETYQHENHPDYKTSHQPQDWEDLYQAAKKGETWNGLVVTLNHPVIGVDWWDAYTYCSYYDRRLPTQEEWYAALSSTPSASDIELEASPWGPVDQTSRDITLNGIHGLAGNVSEWTLKQTKPTHDPTATKKRPVICGAAYNNTSEGALHREFVRADEDTNDARDTRRPNLGFRTVAQPETE